MREKKGIIWTNLNMTYTQLITNLTLFRIKTIFTLHNKTYKNIN